MNQTNDLNTIRAALLKCANHDERVALICMLQLGADDKAEVVNAAPDRLPKRRYVGNDYNGHHVYDFCSGGRHFTYSPCQGADGSGHWYVEINKFAEYQQAKQQ